MRLCIEFKMLISSNSPNHHNDRHVICFTSANKSLLLPIIGSNYRIIGSNLENPSISIDCRAKGNNYTCSINKFVLINMFIEHSLRNQLKMTSLYSIFA